MKIWIALCGLLAAVAGNVSHLSSNDYLPPSYHHAASAPAVSFSAAPSYNVEAASAPAFSYSGSAADSFQAGAASAPQVSYAAPAAEVSYAAPGASYETGSYDVAASEPAHSYSSAEGYRYKTAKRRVIRRQRRDVSHLSNDYLPPGAASAPAAQYESAPSYYEAASAPQVSYAAPAAQVAYDAPGASYETGSYDVAASEPAHSYSSAEGYRYKTAKRRVIRRQRRDVSHLSNDYLPPGAASAPAAQYESAPSYYEAASAPQVSYAAPAAQVSYDAPGASYETGSYDVAASEPAHSYSSAEGYRYKTAKRRVIRRHRF